MSTLTPQTVADTIAADLGERILDVHVAYGQATLTVAPDAWQQAARFCKQTLGMTFFDWLGGVDEREDGFAVVTRLYNHITRQAVLLRVLVPGGRDTPVLPTLTGVYRGADWHERETYDMYGIVFEDHPGLLPRILTVENFEGWPLRKDFPLASRDVKPWPGAKEPGGDDGETPPAAAAPGAPGQDPTDRAAAAKAKAERAKAKAAEARKRKAEERAAAMGEEGGAASSDEPDPLTPEGAAEIAGTPEAMDAAAGQVDGDTSRPAPGDPADSDQPDIDPDREAEVADGGPAQPGGTPGVEAEGIHDLEDSSVRTDSVTYDAGGTDDETNDEEEGTTDE